MKRGSEASGFGNSRSPAFTFAAILGGVMTALIWSSSVGLESSVPARGRANNGQTIRLQSQVPPKGARAFRDVEYVANGHARQKLDIYVPASGTNFPLIVWVHGGAWREGSKDNTRATWLLDEGYAVASINYRLSQHAVFPAQLEDCKAAIRWLRANASRYGYDPNRIGVWGASAGGHLVSLLGTTGDTKGIDVGDNLGVSSRVQAVCDFFGPSDLTKMDEQAGAAGRFRHDAPDSPESKLIGVPVQENREKTARANPINYVSSADPPFLILHGDRDDIVPFGQSDLLYEALKKAKVDVTYLIIKGAGHGGAGFESSEIRALVAAFFGKHFKAGTTKSHH